MAVAAHAAEPVLASLSEVKPVLEAMRDELPPALAQIDDANWNSWSRRQDADIRARLERGEIDSMINLLLFGTSFTERPRIQFEQVGEASRSGLLRSRVDDLLRGLRSPSGNDRLVLLRNLIRRQGLDPDATDGKLGLFVYENLQRVLRESIQFGERVQAAPRDPIFRDRGVSLDATIAPNFVIEETLRELKNRGVLGQGSVTRVAVIGPGLDFTDKQSGYDYYPQQTLQPFAVHDSLTRLDLARDVKVTVFDISSRVLEHVERARELGRQGRSYTIQLPRDPQQGWTPAAVDYWRAFGDRSGEDVEPTAPPSGLDARAVEIRPDVVLASQPVDLNVVLQRLDLPAAERFDLIVATNVFVYYDRLQQALALQNVSTLLKPGGILLTNNQLPEIPQIPMRKLGETAVRYSERLGETVVWYRRE